MATTSTTILTALNVSAVSTTSLTPEPCVLCELYVSMRHTIPHPYLATIPGSGARDGKRLIVIVKRAARIPGISYFLSS